MLALVGHLGFDLRGVEQGVVEGVDLVEHDKALADPAVEMIAPDRKVAAGHAGIGSQQEHCCVRRWQQGQRELGLGAYRVQTRGVDHHQTALEQRVRVVDQRVPPGG